MELDVPRDRNGEFKPVVIPKNKRDVCQQTYIPVPLLIFERVPILQIYTF